MSKERYKLTLAATKANDSAFDALVNVYPFVKGSKDWKGFLSFGESQNDDLQKLIKRTEIKAEAGAVLSFDRSASQRASVVLFDSSVSTFKLLGLSKDIVTKLRDLKASTIRLNLSPLSAEDAR
ncbi:MAG: hypothetical protein EOP07_24730, partial [Proteobacteria bacterium]